MITTLLAFVCLIAIPAFTFVAGVHGTIKTLKINNPDLFAEWEKRVKESLQIKSQARKAKK